MTKHVREQHEEKVLFWLQLSGYSPSVWKSKCQGIEASGHMASTLRNLAMNTRLCSTLLVYLNSPGAWLGKGSTSVSIIKVIPKDMPTSPSLTQVILDSGKLTINTDPHGDETHRANVAVARRLPPSAPWEPWDALNVLLHHWNSSVYGPWLGLVGVLHSWCPAEGPEETNMAS